MITAIAVSVRVTAGMARAHLLLRGADVGGRRGRRVQQRLQPRQHRDATFRAADALHRLSKISVKYTNISQTIRQISLNFSQNLVPKKMVVVEWFIMVSTGVMSIPPPQLTLPRISTRKRVNALALALASSRGGSG